MPRTARRIYDQDGRTNAQSRKRVNKRSFRRVKPKTAPLSLGRVYGPHRDAGSSNYRDTQMNEEDQIHDLAEILRRRTRLFWLIIAACITSVTLTGLLVFLGARLSAENKQLNLQTNRYLRCLAELFVRSQTEKILIADLDKCSYTTEANPTPTPIVIPQEGTGTQLPAKNSSQQGSGGQNKQSTTSSTPNQGNNSIIPKLNIDLGGIHADTN